jgi:2-iminobutanoate/2-iminopropanoate deaminase
MSTTPDLRLRPRRRGSGSRVRSRPGTVLALAASILTAVLAVGCDANAPGAVMELGPDAAPAQAPQVIETDRAPAAIGPYSQGILVGSTLYLAGQIALDPETNEMVAGGIEAETHRVMQNLGAVLEAAGFDFEDVVQSQVFLADLEDFQAMNEVYGEYFSEPYPTRATVQVARLPRDALVEIQLVAVRAR